MKYYLLKHQTWKFTFIEHCIEIFNRQFNDMIITFSFTTVLMDTNIYTLENIEHIRFLTWLYTFIKRYITLLRL